MHASAASDFHKIKLCEPRRVISGVGLLLIAIGKEIMQRYKYFLASIVATVCLLGYVAFAQTKTQSSPLVVSAVAPFYPVSARAIALQGDFLVDVEIDRNGKVTSAEFSKDSPNQNYKKIVQKVLEEAASRWQFAPDENAEKKRRVQLTFTFRYTPKASNLDSTTIFYPPYKIEVRDNVEIKSSPSY